MTGVRFPLPAHIMKYLFFVQGEGRGHMTQALTLKELLESRGHQVVAVIVGASPERPLPSFFKEQINVPLFIVDSPAFVMDKRDQGIKILASVCRVARRLPRYFSSLKKIKTIVAEYRPDVLVNFYEILAGNYYRFYHDKRPMFCLGHQYFLNHSSFKFPPGILNRLAIKSYNHLNAPRRATKIALSFTAEADEPRKKLIVCPPLIRRAIKQQAAATGDFILVYLLNAGYSQEISRWAQAHPDVKIEAFWDKPNQAETHYGQNLVFHHLSGAKFIDCLAACRAFVATAGFDSIAEAAYLQKTILMIPTKNHFEQACNAADATRANLALSAANFNLSLVIDKTKTHSSDALRHFKDWADDYENKIVAALEKSEKSEK